MNNHRNDERVARLEGGMERTLGALSELKSQQQAGRDDLARAREKLEDDISKNRLELKGDIERSRLELKREVAESRQESRESVKELRRDFRMLLGFQLSSTVALIAAMAKGFGWM